MNPALNNHQQPFAPGYSPEDAKAFFAMDFVTTNFDCGSTNSSAYSRGNIDYLPFRTTFPTQSYAPPIPAAAAVPIKIEREHPQSIMPIQISNVDTSQYHAVSQEEVFRTSVDYGVVSPTSTTSDEAAPVTPASDHLEAYSTWYEGKFGGVNARSYSDAASGAVLESQAASVSSFGSVSGSSGSWSASSFTGSSSVFSGLDSFSSSDDSFTQPLGPATAHPGPATALQGPQFNTPAFEEIDMVSDQNDGGSETDEDANSTSSSAADVEAGAKDDRDQFLLSLRNQGYSYKEIKRRGKFREAESTLRGRMRVLTKEKHERVRKPEWQRSDIELLRRAVREFTDAASTGLRRKADSKLPWLKISRWMKNNGASYEFAAATCAKRWASMIG